MSRSSFTNARTSLSSASSFSISSPVSFARRMLRIASACRSLSLNRFCSCALAVGVSSAARMSLMTASMLSTAILSPSRMCSRSSALSSSNCVRRTTTCVPVLDVVLEHFLERHDLRHELARVRIGHERQHDHAERRLHRRVLVQLVEHHARNRIALELDHDRACRPCRTRRADREIPSSFLSVTSSAMSAIELRLVDLVRKLVDDDLRLVRAIPSPR